MKGYMKAYKFEIFPNKIQRAFLSSHFGCCRLIYNNTLAEILPRYEAYREALKEFYSYPQNQGKDKNGHFLIKFTPEEQEKFFYSFPENKSKPFVPVEKPPITRNSICRKESGITRISEYRETITDDNGVQFLKELDSAALSGVISNIEAAFRTYEKQAGAGLPRFKKKSGYQSYSTRRIVHATQDLYDLMVGNIKYDADAKKILLPKFSSVWQKYGEIPGWIKVAAHIDIRQDDNPCYISSVVVSLTPEGKYYISLLVYYQNNPFETLQNTNQNAGVSYSVSDNAYIVADNNGIKYRYNVDLEKLARIDQHISDLMQKRSKMRAPHKEQNGDFIPPSNNYKKISRRINKLMARRSRMIDYAQHCISKELMRDYDKIYARDLEAKDLMERKKAENPDMTNNDVAYLNTRLNNMAIGSFLHKLEYKAIAYERVLYRIDKYYPCSKTCSNCGHVNQERATTNGSWQCPACGVIHKTCENSAKNILREGQSILMSPQDYKKAITERKKTQDKFVTAMKSRIFNVIRDYNEQHEQSIAIGKGKVASLARVLSKQKDVTDDLIIEQIKELTSTSKRSKIKK